MKNLNNLKKTNSKSLNPKLLIYHSQPRFKFWTWSELSRLTGQNQQQIINQFKPENKTELQNLDPFGLLIYNHKNYNKAYTEIINNNYPKPEAFEIITNQHGIAPRFVHNHHSPYNCYLTNNTDWFWKQKWLAKHKSVLFAVPFVNNIFLACSVASQVSSEDSDVDLLIQVTPNTVWIVKIYFAIISKVLKYYDFNWFLGMWLLVSGQKTELENLKHSTLVGKIKLDFGMVFEDWSVVETIYADKERHYSIWNNIDLKNNLNYFEPLLTKVVATILKFIFIILIPPLTIIGLIHYFWQFRHNKNNPNMVVRWAIYSQYNVIY